MDDFFRHSKEALRKAEERAVGSLEEAVEHTEAAVGKIKRRVKNKAVQLGLRKATFHGQGDVPTLAHSGADRDRPVVDREAEDKREDEDGDADSEYEKVEAADERQHTD